MLKTYLNSTGFNNNIFTTYWVKQAFSYYSIKNQFTFKSHKLILFDLSVCTMNFEIFRKLTPAGYFHMKMKEMPIRKLEFNP